MGDAVRLVLNGRERELTGVPPATTLLDWLRDAAGLKGTKEGCAEGDCGACAVLLETPDGQGCVARRAINACLAAVAQLDGCGVRTVEGLRGMDGAPHPVQRAIAESDGTQCGFCTPGFVMSACAFAAGGEPPEPALIHDALAGNLCRCTGYRPIVEAVQRTARLEDDPLRADDAALADALAAVAPAAPRRFSTATQTVHAPRSLDDLLTLRAERPNALLLAGGTDVGLLASHRRTPPAEMISLAGVAELASVERTGDGLLIGGAATYADVLPHLEGTLAPFARYLTRLGSRQIRAMGTMAGNIGTASPIGDSPPPLLALDAVLRLQSSARGLRRVPISEFFLGYRKTALAPDEAIVGIEIARPAAADLFACEKVSKRRDQDISAVCAGLWLRLDGDRVAAARLGFGGMAATPKRAFRAEAALIGHVWTEAAVERAATALADEFSPIDDWRATAAYRRVVAANLLRRLWRRSVGEPELDAL